MKILVLGNGFDVDHGLPTSYISFMRFCDYLVYDKGTHGVYYNKLTETQKSYVKQLDKQEKLLKKFRELLDNNNLYYYFSSQIDRQEIWHQGKNWIDLEREIKDVVRELRDIEEEFAASKSFRYAASSSHLIHELIERLRIANVDSGKIDEVTLAYIHETLCSSLTAFSRALELYLTKFINTTAVRGVSPDIVEFDATHVVTFNYSNTYERVYGGVHWKEEVDHIHGIAGDINTAETNVVLGITTPSDKQDRNRYVEFEKYFQRITKRTGNRYRDWFNSIPNGAMTVEVMFFGHSLDSSDSDIINDLISNPNTAILICYHSEQSQKDIVANLIEIIGKKKLIEYVSGKKPKIRFVKQKPHVHQNTAGVEIERDIRKLLKLHTLKSKDVSRLLEKIDKRVRQKKLSYFFTQKKAMDLFDAMEYIGLHTYKAEDFLELCQNLGINTVGRSLIMFDHQDWCGETIWEETIECSGEMKKLVDLVNASNEVRFQEQNNRQPYAYMKKLKTKDEIKEALLCVFAKEPSEKYWRGLNELIHAMIENDLLWDAVKELETGAFPISIHAKVKHFAHSYYEMVYDYQLQKDWAEARKQELEPV